MPLAGIVPLAELVSLAGIVPLAELVSLAGVGAANMHEGGLNYVLFTAMSC